jgi:hypothetical protein
LTYLQTIIDRGFEPSTVEVGPTPQVALTVKDLRVGIALQALHSLSRRAGVRQCCNPACGRYFEFGTGTGKRSTRRYCSTPCQSRDYYRRKHQQVEAT